MDGEEAGAPWRDKKHLSNIIKCISIRTKKAGGTFTTEASNISPLLIVLAPDHPIANLLAPPQYVTVSQLVANLPAPPGYSTLSQLFDPRSPHRQPARQPSDRFLHKCIKITSHACKLLLQCMKTTTHMILHPTSFPPTFPRHQNILP